MLEFLKPLYFFKSWNPQFKKWIYSLNKFNTLFHTYVTCYNWLPHCFLYILYILLTLLTILSNILLIYLCIPWAFFPAIIFSIIHFYFIFLPVIPKGRPQIEDMVAPKGGGFLYKPGDWLSLNCTSQPSRPPTRLTWFVNGREVSCD